MTALAELTNASAALGSRQVLHNVSLTLRRGEVVGLLGPNGAGKTTLLRALLGVVSVAAGAARLGDAHSNLLSNRERALRAAYLPQRPQSVWPVSVEALVALGRFAHGAVPDRLAVTDKAAVDAAIKSCALEALRKRRMDEISGGERARAHLARALAQRAPLLLLDEPTAGLDPAQALGVADILRSHAAGGGAVLFSTHDLALAVRTAHRVMLLSEGHMIAEGPPDALTPENLLAAYGRKGIVQDIGGVAVAVFE